MADIDFPTLLQNFSDQLTSVISAQGVAQGIANTVTPFEGDRTKFKEWIKAVEKFACLTGLDRAKIKFVAYQFSRSAVSDYIKRYLSEHDACTWEELKQDLSNKFAEITDPQHALLLLRKVKQLPNENVHIYAERLINLAEDAYRNTPPGGEGTVNLQLVGFFIDGLHSDLVRMKVMRENPLTLQAAVAVATREEDLRVRYDLRLNQNQETQKVKHRPRVPIDPEEPMEVGHARSRRCYKCNRLGHIAKHCRVRNDRIPPRKDVNAVNNAPRAITCWRCGVQGHFMRDCRQGRPTYYQRGSGGHGVRDSHDNPNRRNDQGNMNPSRN